MIGRRNRRGDADVVVAMVRLAALLCITALLAGGCALLQPAATGPLVSVEAHGGLCPEGECRSLVAIDRDGRLLRLAPDPGEMGRLEPRTVSAIEVAIASTDFAALRARRFTGECPTAFDGQELIYTFNTPSGEERIASCEVEIDESHPLFAALRAALEASPP
jgi:hypothetical protein